MSLARRNGDVSFWYASTAIPPRRPPLPGDRQADVCIVGAGFTGLWTAYYLKRARPELEVVLLEREFAGFGASGRNGGWLSDRFAAPREAMARTHGREAVLALQRAMQATVDEVIGVCGQEGIDADIVKNGLVFVARGPAQTARLRAHAADDRDWELDDDRARPPGARAASAGGDMRARARGPRIARVSSRRSSCRAWRRPWSGWACRSTRARGCARCRPERSEATAARCAPPPC